MVARWQLDCHRQGFTSLRSGAPQQLPPVTSHVPWALRFHPVCKGPWRQGATLSWLVRQMQKNRINTRPDPCQIKAMMWLSATWNTKLMVTVPRKQFTNSQWKLPRISLAAAYEHCRATPRVSFQSPCRWTSSSPTPVLSFGAGHGSALGIWRVLLLTHSSFSRHTGPVGKELPPSPCRRDLAVY